MYLLDVDGLLCLYARPLCRKLLEFFKRNITNGGIACLVRMQQRLVVLAFYEEFDDLVDLRECRVFQQRQISAAISDQQSYCLDIKAESEEKKLCRSFVSTNSRISFLISAKLSTEISSGVTPLISA